MSVCSAAPWNTVSDSRLAAMAAVCDAGHDQLSWQPTKKPRKINAPHGLADNGVGGLTRIRDFIMQKVLLSVAAAAALSFASFSAAAVTQDGAFIGVNGGRSHYSVSHTYFDDNNDTGFGAVVGYRWVVDRPFSLGVEVGYANLGKQTAKDSYIQLVDVAYATDYKYKFKSQALLIGANGKWDLPHGWTITARAGFAHSRSTFDVSATTSSSHGTSSEWSSEDTNDNGVYAGLGFGYDFNENFGLTLTYDHFATKAQDIIGDKRTVNVGVTGLAAEYRFW
jgi:OmpA-OmpF porin, OOP family